MKQSFPIPENCTTVTVEQVENKIVCTFEETFEPKDGDFVAGTVASGLTLISIYKSKNVPGLYNSYCNVYSDGTYLDKSTTSLDVLWAKRLATESEKQTLLNALAKDGKKWNAELKRVEKLRWRASEGGTYFIVYYDEQTSSADSRIDKRGSLSERNYSCGNYFQTKEQAESAADRINAIFAENL